MENGKIQVTPSMILDMITEENTTKYWTFLGMKKVRIFKNLWGRENCWVDNAIAGLMVTWGCPRELKLSAKLGNWGVVGHRVDNAIGHIAWPREFNVIYVSRAQQLPSFLILQITLSSCSCCWDRACPRELNVIWKTAIGYTAGRQLNVIWKTGKLGLGWRCHWELNAICSFRLLHFMPPPAPPCQANQPPWILRLPK